MTASSLIVFNKPYQVLSQFTQNRNIAEHQATLSEYIDFPDAYPAGRLDYDSEGLLLLTNSGALQARISQPKFKLGKHYWAQVEGSPEPDAISALNRGVLLKDGKTRPARASLLQSPPELWERDPPVVQHRSDNSSWLNIVLTEGKNRQVRRMCAAVGHPVLRLIRYQIGSWTLEGLQPGQYRVESVHLPVK